MKIRLRLEHDPDFIIDRASYKQIGVTTRDITMPCSTGEGLNGRWRGLPLKSLLESSRLPNETTHFQVRSNEEYTVCINLSSLWDALIAFERVDRRSTLNLPRLVGPCISGHDSVKKINSIKPLAFEPADDVREYESKD